MPNRSNTPAPIGRMLGTAGACLIGMAGVWSVAAAWLSANLVISVIAEFASYWLCLFAVACGGYLHIRSQGQTITAVGLLGRSLYAALALLIVVASWRWSDQRFFLYKLGRIPPQAWARMAIDLEKVGRRAADSRGNLLPIGEKPPESLQRLGTGLDYSGTFGSVIRSPEYSGVTAGILFGYKGRSWGLCVGPESFAKKYSRGTNYIQVATNGFFFVEPRD